MAFDRLSRCFLLLLCLGGLFLVINLINMQTVPLQIGKTLFKGIFFSEEEVIIHVEKSKPDLHPSTTSHPFLFNLSGEVKEIRGNYTVLPNYIVAENRPFFNATVTLCTQGTYEFLHHVNILCSRWQAPISVAVYAPGDDFISAHLTISYLRQCGPPCVVENVTWHMIYDTNFPPGKEKVIVKPINCSDSLNLSSNFKAKKGLLYPINVARNIARLKAETYYVFSSDIELYPSIGIVTQFLDMVHKENNSDTLRIYAVPVFEIKKTSKLPNVKSELSKMMSKGEAVFFHKYICDACQRFPNREAWLKNFSSNGSMGIFIVTKRNSSLASWEPIYISTNQVPLYNEILSWEGKKDKMSQMYELCLLGYDVYILNNAFLVHAPGIKMGTLVRKDHARRLKYVKTNNKWHGVIMNSLRKKYGNHYNC